MALEHELDPVIAKAVRNAGSQYAIRSRLNHVLDFLAAQDASGGQFSIATGSAAACTPAFAHALRASSRRQPVVWRNKDGAITASKPRTPSATKASIAQVIAVLNHAASADPPRSDKRPIFRPLPPSQIQRVRRTQIGVDEIAKMLRYAAEPAKRRGSCSDSWWRRSARSRAQARW